MIYYLRACLKYFAFAGFFSLFINTLYLVFPLYMLAVYTRVLDSYNFSTLYAITAMALVALLVLSCLDLLRSRLLVRAGVKLDQLLTRPVLRQMLMDLSRVDSTQYNRGLQDINTLRNYLGGNAIFAFFDVPWIFIYLWVIYLVHPILGMTATAGAVIILIMGLAQTLLTKKHAAQMQQVNQQGKQWMNIGFRTAGELESMGMARNAAAGFSRINDTELALQEKVNQKNHVFTAAGASFGVLMQVLIFGVGAVLVLMNEANPGVIIAASIIMGRALAPVNQGISALKQTSGAKTAYDNLQQLLTNAAKQQTQSLATLEGDLKVDNIRLDIHDTTVLQDVAFHLKPGEFMGLVGPNGAGKTSLCRLILGMWSPTQGQVTLDGNDVTILDNESLGRFLGYLPQNVELFSGSISENIARMGEVEDREVVEAAENAGAHDVILALAAGYDTDIGESGGSISGGQRQRVGLARALYKHPRLVILDEPDANLDEAGETALMAALKHLKQMGTTTIMITHKPQLLQAVDKILILQNGRMAGFGDKEKMFGQMMENT
ncbi:MAG: type I secretion system permease/ATPase [Desulfobacteraceae bacterium]|nr:type I secretion system permease/ATPase [Desulfobacteraceae bacterium]